MAGLEERTDNDLRVLQERLGYRFRQTGLLIRALTHASYGHELVCDDNERLEFLGDAVADFVVSVLLFRRFYWWDEGELTQARSDLVSSRTMAAKAAELGIGEYLRLGRGERLAGGHSKSSLLANAFEAILAAILLDGGIDKAARTVSRLFATELAALRATNRPPNARAALREQLSSLLRGRAEYRQTAASGSGKVRFVQVALFVDGVQWSTGEGRTRIEAEQRAASLALRRRRSHTAPAAGE
ncbi:MAG: ribonuclease III [Candidatus Schekmanbacteria bacterium]|nr:ribonuclease III [Candidatus Schekmanbacteria bacterium]